MNAMNNLSNKTLPKALSSSAIVEPLQFLQKSFLLKSFEGTKTFMYFNGSSNVAVINIRGFLKPISGSPLQMIYLKSIQ